MGVAVSRRTPTVKVRPMTLGFTPARTYVGCSLVMIQKCSPSRAPCSIPPLAVVALSLSGILKSMTAKRANRSIDGKAGLVSRLVRCCCWRCCASLLSYLVFPETDEARSDGCLPPEARAPDSAIVLLGVMATAPGSATGLNPMLTCTSPASEPYRRPLLRLNCDYGFQYPAPLAPAGWCFNNGPDLVPSTVPDPEHLAPHHQPGSPSVPSNRRPYERTYAQSRHSRQARRSRPEDAARSPDCPQPWHPP
ncbi:hypothetical protein HPB47_018273 [Ixodes persulcatus]|uniref:Uncharacterized protein n=1 Tax=Ixodes persulcatus TaxID=34615 RepID=A0AC60R070_IXOPE|nr:hypothetical protein HPB47_018273 [Ixodes persulcatus]